MKIIVVVVESQSLIISAFSVFSVRHSSVVVMTAATTLICRVVAKSD